MKKKKGGPSMLERKVREAYSAARGCGETYLAMTLINVLSVYISGNKELLAGLALLSRELAKAAVEKRGDGSLELPTDSDPLDEKLQEIITVASSGKRNDIAALMAATSSLYATDDRELLWTLAECASSLSSEGVGRRPAKAVLLVENDLGALGPDPEKKDEPPFDLFP